MSGRKRKASGGDLRYGLRAYKMARKSGFKPNRARAGYTTVPRTRGVYAKGEMKYADREQTAIAIPAAPTWAGTELEDTQLCVHSVPMVGAGIGQRVGKKIDVYSLKIRGTVSIPKQANQTALDNAACCRLVLFMDQQTNSTQAQGEQVMDGDFNGGGGGGVRTFQQINNFGRFKVLKDVIINLEDPNSAWDGTNMEQNGKIRYFKWFIKFKKPLRMTFNDTNGGTVADLSTVSMHLIGTTTSADLVPTLEYCCRMCYKDA